MGGREAREEAKGKDRIKQAKKDASKQASKTSPCITSWLVCLGNFGGGGGGNPEVPVCTEAVRFRQQQFKTGCPSCCDKISDVQQISCIYQRTWSPKGIWKQFPRKEPNPPPCTRGTGLSADLVLACPFSASASLNRGPCKIYPAACSRRGSQVWKGRIHVGKWWLSGDRVGYQMYINVDHRRSSSACLILGRKNNLYLRVTTNKDCEWQCRWEDNGFSYRSVLPCLMFSHPESTKSCSLEVCRHFVGRAVLVEGIQVNMLFACSRVSQFHKVRS